MSNIMKISREAGEVITLFDLSDGEITPELNAMLEALNQDVQAYTAISADIIDELGARMNARKERAKELTALAKRDEAMIERAKAGIVQAMQIANVDKLQIGGLSVTLSKGQESVEILDEEEVPASYKRATITLPANELGWIKSVAGERITSEKVEVDKTAIKLAHKASNGEIGIAGTAIVRKPYVIIKG